VVRIGGISGILGQKLKLGGSRQIGDESFRDKITIIWVHVLGKIKWFLSNQGGSYDDSKRRQR